MFIKIIAVITITVGICTAEPANMLPKYDQEQTNHQAVSTVKFQRQDVPFTYNYYSIHPHSNNKAEKPIKYVHTKSTPQSLYARSIQYAPIIRSSKDLNTKINETNHIENNFHDPTVTIESAETTIRVKKPSEPNLKELSSTPAPIDAFNNIKELSWPNMDYIPGHNIAVMRSVDRSPGLNAIYNSYTESPRIDRDKKKVNYLNQYKLSSKHRGYGYIASLETSRSTTTSTLITTPSTRQTITKQKPTSKPKTTIPKTRTEQSTSHSIVYKLQPPPKPIPSVIGKDSANKTSYSNGMHMKLLNVARLFHAAPQKSLPAVVDPIMSRSLYGFGLIDQSNQKRSLFMKIPGFLQLQVPKTDQKTILYPIYKKLHFSMHP